MPEEILEDEKADQEDGSIDSPHYDSLSPFKPGFSERESEPPDPAEQVLTMRLRPPSTKKS